MKKTISVRELSLVGLMPAMVYVTSAFLQIPIPTVIGNTRIHMGNVMCLLSGLLLGPLWGGLAAGIGSVFFDLTNPAYIASAPFTFVFKFLMAWVCGILYQKWKGKGKVILFSALAGTAGALTYVILYLAKNFFESYIFLQLPLAGVLVSIGEKGVVSLANGIIAVVVAVPLSMAIRPAISRMLAQN